MVQDSEGISSIFQMNRLLRAASLPDRKLILECYHPSAQYTEPYLYCDYLGTPGLSDEFEGRGKIYQIADNPQSGPPFQKLYSRFRPTRREQESRASRPHPAGDIPGSRTSEAADLRRLIREAEVVKRNISLEAHELFTQLCFSANLVQVGPRNGVFTSIVDAIETKTIRIWKQWLAERARDAEECKTDASNGTPEHLPDETTKELRTNNDDIDRLIWVDQNQIAGLRLRVKERRWQRDMPVLLHKDEDQAVSYSLELDELLISTIHLMLAVERSLLETGQDSGRAMVFGSFAPTRNEQQAQDSTAG
ncbi:hypothetical protein ACLMJK_005114 [Lecanora helva]